MKFICFALRNSSQTQMQTFLPAATPTSKAIKNLCARMITVNEAATREEPL